MALDQLDAKAFSSQMEPYRRELQIHCYRMTGSVQDAEDMVQETLTRAWKRRETLQDARALRAWLYRIATNICLDTLKNRSRRVIPQTHQRVSDADAPIPGDVEEPIWLEPFPDEYWHSVQDSVDSIVLGKESIALAFVAAIHLLPPRQRAILILRDVLDWKAAEVAEALETSESAVKSALFRARTTLAEHKDRLPQNKSVTLLDDGARLLLEKYVRAWHSADVDELMRLLIDDATFSMPPIPSWYQGRDQIRKLVAKTIFSGSAEGRWMLLSTHANTQLAFGLYRNTGTPAGYGFYGIQVLTLTEAGISDIVTFRKLSLARFFNLPATIHSQDVT